MEKLRKLNLRNMLGAPSHCKKCANRKLTTPKPELNALAKTSDERRKDTKIDQIGIGVANQCNAAVSEAGAYPDPGSS